jgi:hypothetical protein
MMPEHHYALSQTACDRLLGLEHPVSALTVLCVCYFAGDRWQMAHALSASD